jgi:carboxyl-terminal processing protease
MPRRFCLAWLLLVLLAGQVLAGAPTDQAEPKNQKQTATRDEEYKLQRLLVDTLDEVERNYIKPISRRELVEAAIRGVLRELDPYSNYIDPQDMPRFRTAIENQFGGVGVQIGIENGRLEVISPLVGSPAYRAGVRAGDRIVEIDGKSTRGLLIDEVVERMKGEPGTRVTLGIIHPGSDKKEDVTLTREVVQIETVLGYDRKADDSWNFMLDRDKGIGYIRLAAFSRNTARDLRKALVQLKQENLRGLILDLRFNPGGLLSSAVEVADLFISEGRIVSIQGRNTEEKVWNAKKRGTFEGFPMAVLVNRYSASASEIVSACLQDHHRAVIVGERTWGKGSVQNVIEMEEGASALKLTTASYRRPSGKNIHRFPGAAESDEWGVMPDAGYELKLSDEDTARLMDEFRRRDIVRPNQAEAVSLRDQTSADQKPGPQEKAGQSAGSAGETPTAGEKFAGRPGNKAAGAKVGFVDRPLEKAMQYLSREEN